MIYPDGDLTTVGVKVTSYISPPHQSPMMARDTLLPKC